MPRQRRGMLLYEHHDTFLNKCPGIKTSTVIGISMSSSTFLLWHRNPADFDDGDVLLITHLRRLIIRIVYVYIIVGEKHAIGIDTIACSPAIISLFADAWVREAIVGPATAMIKSHFDMTQNMPLLSCDILWQVLGTVIETNHCSHFGGDRENWRR